MGGICCGGTERQKAKVGDKNSGFSGKLKSVKSHGKHKENSFSGNIVEEDDVGVRTPGPQRYNSGELLMISRELKPSTAAREGAASKANQKSSFFLKAGTIGLEKAVEVFDTLGSSMSNLNARNGFVSGMASKGNRISILAFEVANTVAKGANLFQSLSEENIEFLKKDILSSEGVQQLVSTEEKELLIIAAADKREELEVFSKEVIRFGDLCKDPQWHNLDRYFSKLDSEYSTDKQLRTEAELTMQELSTLAQHTSELYHELHALDRFQQDYQRRIEELESLNLPQRGESLAILESELKEQRKLVRSLKKKSLWCKHLEEIMEKFVDIVTYLHQAIIEAFGNNGVRLVNDETGKNPERLGPAGLALHYANIINQIDSIASRPTGLPSNMRDNLYHALPPSVKTALRSQLPMIDVKEELTIAEVKAEMEKTLQWLVPVAANTTKAHQGFGWVGEWANAGSEAGKNPNLIRLQTLYHANKQKTELYILELVTWLQRLINLVRHQDPGCKAMLVRSPTCKGTKVNCTQLSQEDRDLFAKVSWRKLGRGISKSQEFAIAKKGRMWAFSRSAGTSPIIKSDTKKKLEPPRNIMLDAMDGLNPIYNIGSSHFE